MLNSEITGSNTKSYLRKVVAFTFEVLRTDRKFDDVVTDLAPRVRSFTPHKKPDIAMEDCHILLSAVTSRLRACVSPRQDSNSEPQLPIPNLLNQVHSNVLECAAALEQLHRTLSHEHEQGQRHKLQARNDSLTPPSAREYFIKRLDRLLAMVAPNRQALALLSFDLDRLRLVTTMHGRAAGEELVVIMDART
jgi:predicted signal transduction protein with EAL and GGDEF domain